ncbi:MAG TPA: S53 family serine peptidase [Terracidiphilus sp.]
MKLRTLAASVTLLSAFTAAGISQSVSSAAFARPQVMGAADPSTTTHFSVYLPLTHQAELEKLVNDQTDASSPSYHKWLTPAQFKEQFGPKPATFAKVRRKLEAAGFTVTAEHTQSLDVTGRVADVESLLSTQLQTVKMPHGGTALAAANHRMTLPAELASVGAMIPEFNPHLAAHVHSVKLSAAAAGTPLASGGGVVNQRLSSADSYFYPDDMNEAYVFPSFTTSIVPVSKQPSGAPAQIEGAGTTIGIVISSTVLQSDINAAFNSTVSAGTPKDVQNFSGNTSVPVPVATIEKVNGGSGAFNPSSDDADEASLDTQMSLGTAPGAHEIVYDMPNLSDANILAAYTQVNTDNKVDVVSSSFGECELDFTPAYNGGTDYTYILQAFHNAFVQGNAQGITFLASSGDNGAVPCVSAAFSNNPQNGTNFVLGVENPASDPNVTAVGGTNLQVAATPTANDSTYVSENANYDPRVPATFSDGVNSWTVGNNTWGSGGGYSSVFAKPTYQNTVATGSTTQRAVPDISLMMGGCPGDADINAQDCTRLPRSAAIVWIAGTPNLLIGTSSSSPQMAAVLALEVELQGSRLGNANFMIYHLASLQSAASGKTANLSQFFHRNISGNNNGYTVSPGQAYSPVLGVGTVFVKTFLGIPTAAPAGTPSTPTNP